MKIFLNLIAGQSPVAYAQDDDGEDIVDIEGEDGGVVAEEEPEEESITVSKDIETTILFISPVINPLSSLGKILNKLIIT